MKKMCILLIGVIILGCATTSNSVETTEIEGKWVNPYSGSMQSTYKFTGNNWVYTAIGGPRESGTFEIDDELFQGRQYLVKLTHKSGVYSSFWYWIRTDTNGKLYLHIENHQFFEKDFLTRNEESRVFTKEWYMATGDFDKK